MNRSATGFSSWSFRWFLAVVFIATWAGVASAQGDAAVVRVEEDWELVIGTPDPNSDAPQITCVISPSGNVESLHAALELNAQSLPVFAPGGLQLQVWDGEVALSDRKFPSVAVLEHADETIGWTQSVELTDGNLVFEITNGTSTTWGNFGGQGYLKAIVSSTLADLGGYDPAVSTANSGVSYAGNRVKSLVLKRVRLITSTGEQVEDATARVVHAQE